MSESRMIHEFPASCSCLALTSKQGRSYWFRTCDLHTSVWEAGAHVVSFPARQSIQLAGGPAQARYALLGVTYNDRDTWLLDGINSQGLTGGLLLLEEGTSVPAAEEGRAGVMGMELVTALLASYEAVIAAHTGHVNCHETGAIEATGHKVCVETSPDGKVTPAMVEAVLARHDGTEHMVSPKMVYISDTTEIGTVYTKAELTALRHCCDEHGLLLFLDGARLGSALTSPESDLTLADLAALTDVFTIGGTKNGALFGEAVVLTVPCPHFRWHIKQRGGMLAKGRLLGVQFQALLKDDLYFDIGRHANDMAFRLRDGFKALGYEFPVPSPSNQQFPVMKIQTAEKLAAMGFEFQVERVIDEEHIMYRFVTSWATPESAIDDLLNALAQCQ